MKNDSDVKQRITNLLADRVNQLPEEQITEATRVILEIDEIDSSAAFFQVQDRIISSKKRFIHLDILMRVAAVLFIPLLIITLWLSYRQLTHNQVQQYSMQEITSPPGIRSQVVLPDGSKVWLNAGSTIRFPVPFYNETRNIDLSGEAFFDVEKNPKQPFIVQSGNVKVKVLGTHFNYKAFNEDPTIEIILEEGKIALNMQTKTGINEVLMKPGDRAIVDKESIKATIKNENISKYIAWHKGKLVFDNTPMTEVAQMLARWYGVEVIAKDPEIMNYRFTTTFEDESLYEVIELLGLSSPIRIKYFPATVGKDNQKLTRSKVLISKK